MRSILITGGTGYLGHGLVDKLLTSDIERICILSRGEHAQARMRQEYPDSRMRWFIGDVRDKERVIRAAQGCDTVIHAAALKRIEVGVYNPQEMVKTNVLGSQNLVDACISTGVQKSILVSSDKAFSPVSTYGATKAIAETFFLTSSTSYFTKWGATRFSVCRYGNVAGSTGSVIPIWKEKIGLGKSVNITDPDCTRFWMTRSEAVNFILEALDTMQGGEVFVPALPAFRLGDLADAMNATVNVTGLQAHEKKHESMSEGNSSDKAIRMSIDELRSGLAAL